MHKVAIRVRTIHPNAQLPRPAHPEGEDAGLDLFAAEELVLAPGEWGAAGTGLVLEIPAGYEGQVRPRSGLALKHGVTLLNSPGTIDPGYRGEVKVLLVNHGDEPFTVKRGDRIAQLALCPVGRAARARRSARRDGARRGRLRL